jgi:DNA-directed RNA polymerase specialized sigma24 family protein
MVGENAITVSSTLSICEWRSHMLEPELVALVKSCLEKPAKARTPEEALAREEFVRLCDPIIRAKVWHVPQPGKYGADDLVQDVWVLVMRDLPKWELDPALGSLDRRVAAIATHEAWRRARMRLKPGGVPLDSILAGELLGAEPTADKEFEQMQDHELFQSVVAELAATLDDCDRRIVMLHWIEACPHRRIATDLDLLLDTVRWVLRRAKPMLIDRLRRMSLGFGR